MTAKISIQKCDVFGIDKVGFPNRVNSPPAYQPRTRTELSLPSINLVHDAIRDENNQAANSACDLKNSGVPLSLISNQLRLRIALSLNVSSSTASSLAGMRTFLKGFLGS